MQALHDRSPVISLSPRVRRLVTLSALALLGFVAVYLLAVHTELGQRADEAALTGGRQVPERAQDAADGMLRTVSIGSLVIATAVLSAIALLRRSPEMLLLPAAIVGTSVIAAEVFKLWLFGRPDLVVDSKLIGNSYPSGHAAVFASIGLAALAVAPPRLRGPAALLAVALAAASGVFVVTADWHRPSDPIGSYLLVLAVTAALLALVYARRPGLVTVEQRGAARPPAIARRIERGAVLAGGALFAGAVLLASLRYGAEVDWNRFHAAYLLSAAAIVAAAGIMVGALLRALGPGAPTPAAADSDSVLAAQPGRRRRSARTPMERGT